MYLEREREKRCRKLKNKKKTRNDAFSYCWLGNCVPKLRHKTGKGKNWSKKIKKNDCCEMMLDGLHFLSFQDMLLKLTLYAKKERKSNKMILYRIGEDVCPVSVPLSTTIFESMNFRWYHLSMCYVHEIHNMHGNHRDFICIASATWCRCWVYGNRRRLHNTHTQTTRTWMKIQ